MLNNSDKDALLKLARHSIEAHLNKMPEPEPAALSAELLENRGAFVSLHRKQELRGCIGQIYADRELYKVVRYCAVSAALEDWRFSPVVVEELGDLEIEISVLSPLQRIQAIQEIEVGRHGLYMVHGSRRGLLLPQVATEYGWDRETFLEHTCMKSGLPKSAWQDPKTVIYTFEADVFSESTPADSSKEQ